MRLNSCVSTVVAGFGLMLALGLLPLRLAAHNYPNHIRDEDDQHACGLAGYNGEECNTNCTGMARWWVSEPYCTLWLEDEPLSYQPSRGPRVAFHLSYTDRNTRSNSQYGFSFGNGWECSWMSSAGADYFDASVQGTSTNVTLSAAVYLPGGGVQRYAVTNQALDGDWPANYSSQTRLVPLVTSNLLLAGFERRFADGAKDVYRIPGLNASYLLSARVDALGNTTTFSYNNYYRLLGVVDVDGRATYLGYTNAWAPNVVTHVTNAFGRAVTLRYTQTNGFTFLTNIMDPEGLSSGMVYDSSAGYLKFLTTPYGLTSFTRSGHASGDYMDSWTMARTMQIGDPMGGAHFYAYCDTSFGLTSYSYFDVQGTSPLGTEENFELDAANSFYWNNSQFRAIQAGKPPDTWDATDYVKARLRHWLLVSNAAPQRVGATLSMERAPSPNGVNEGQKTWYDYPSKPNEHTEGSSSLPGVILRRNPDNNVYYLWSSRNVLGFPTNVVETWSASDTGPVLLRTNTFLYSTNGLDLLEAFGPDGQRLAAFGYNTHHQTTFFTNAVGEVTTLTYNGLGQIQQADFPNGLSRTWTYFSSTAYVNWLQSIQDAPTGRSETFAYTDGLPGVWTDARNLTVGLTWDKLQRLTSIRFPDYSTISNRYYRLALSASRDRLNNWTYYGYDQLGRLTSVTNALTNVTTLAYCDCGSPSLITDALGKLTHFTYDFAGRLTTFYNDDTQITYGHDSLGRLTSIFEQTAPYSGISIPTYFSYTANGQQASAYNAIGQLFRAVYDNRDRPVLLTNSVGAGVSNSFDVLGRIALRRFANGSTETFGYDARGLAAFTDRLGAATYFNRDAAGRLSILTNAEQGVLSFTHNPAGDLQTLTDALQHATIWNRDAFGRVTNKFDALNREVARYGYDLNGHLTNRWTAARGDNTRYRLDAIGNVTNVTYLAGTSAVSSITFKYDALRRLTNLVDGVGTHRFTYIASGQLLSEDGPWTNDTLTVDYLWALRTGLTLQQPWSNAWSASYSYDGMRRLETNASPAGAFAYHYLPATGPIPASSPLVGRLDLPTGGHRTNYFDSLAQLRDSWLFSRTGAWLDEIAYQYQNDGRRWQETAGQAITREFSFDRLGQLTNIATTSACCGEPPLEQFAYDYDAAGNLETRTKAGLTHQFYPNAANALTGITRSGTLTVAGFATNNLASITVNGQSGTVYPDGTYAVPGVTLADGTNVFTAVARDTWKRWATNSATNYLPATVIYASDTNGNLLGDGRRVFAYDAENQLTNVYVTNVWRTEYRYDGLARRRIRKEYTWTNSVWLATNETRYVYDGRLVLQERHFDPRISTNTPQKTLTYTRGLDLSGSVDGAGGIGGLLGITTRATNIWQHYYYDLDGVGNVVGLLDTNETFVARYRYDPYGNLLSSSGPMAGLNRLRFSGKEWHPQSGLTHFGFRDYDPGLQRWLTEDPLGELGGINLFQFVDNDPVNLVDPFGLDVYSYPAGQGPQWGLIGPAPYVTGETSFERYIQAPLMNTVSTVVNIPAAAVGFIDWASERMGMTRLLGLSPSDAMVAVAPPLAGEGSLLNSQRASIACPGAKTAATAAQDLLSGAKTIGQAGKNSGVRVVGSIDELNQAFANLSQGGTVVNAPGYTGTMVEFADGSRVGLRSVSGTGGPTIDVFGGGKKMKIHVEP